MSEDIKEILDDIKDNINETPKNMYKYNKIQFNLNECKLLLDYITNLQEENKQLKELCDKYEEEHNNEFQCWKKDRKELLDKRGRINKAIELIKDDGLYEEDTNTFCGEIYSSLPELLNTLQGVDKE